MEPTVINNSPEPKKRNFNKFIIPAVLVLALAGFFSMGLLIGTNGQVPYCRNAAQPGAINFSLFWDAYDQLKQNFIDPSKINDQKILYGAIKGMTSSLEDPYTAFFDPKEAKMFEDGLAGSFDGIGVEVGMKKDTLTVVAPLEGAPGQKAGLKPGDVILKVDGKDTTNMLIDEAVSLIRGPKGTVVTLTVFREGWEKTRDISITRQTITIPSMKWSLLTLPGEDGSGDYKVAHVQIFQFNQNLPAIFKKAALEILNSPAQKIILDLRNNPGGYLEVSQEIAGWFLPAGKTVVIENFGDGRPSETYRSEGNAALAGLPAVVLINQGSASASEILAGALRDNRNVKLVGEKSFGKGSVQEVIEMPGGSFLKITVAKWLTPKGALISDVGLDPDVKVEITEKDAEQHKDPQLDKALEIIKGLQ